MTNLSEIFKYLHGLQIAPRAATNRQKEMLFIVNNQSLAAGNTTNSTHPGDIVQFVSITRCLGQLGQQT
jgi:hypothetical protein